MKTTNAFLFPFLPIIIKYITTIQFRLPIDNHETILKSLCPICGKKLYYKWSVIFLPGRSCNK